MNEFDFQYMYLSYIDCALHIITVEFTVLHFQFELEPIWMYLAYFACFGIHSNGKSMNMVCGQW